MYNVIPYDRISNNFTKLSQIHHLLALKTKLHHENLDIETTFELEVTII